MEYIDGQKYRITKGVQLKTGIFPKDDIKAGPIQLDAKGVLFIKAWYSFDGPSGCTIDTPNTVVPAAVHDAFYEFMRIGMLPIEFRKAVDELFYNLLRENGTSWLRAKAWYTAVRVAGHKSATQKKPRIYAKNPKSVIEI